MDAVPRHLAPRLPFRHRHLNNSERVGYADHVISRLQMSHFTLRRIKPTSFMNSMASAISVEAREENSVWCTVRTQQHTPAGELRNFLHLPQTLLVLPNNFDDVFQHYCKRRSRDDIKSVHKQWIWTELPRSAWNCGCFIKNAETKVNEKENVKRQRTQ